MFVLVLPSIGVLWLECSQKARYNALLDQQQQRRRQPKQRRHVGDSSTSLAAAAGGLAVTAVRTPTSSGIISRSSFSRSTITYGSSSLRLSTDSDSSTKSAAATAAATAAHAFSTSSSSGVQLLRDIASSLQLAADANAAAGHTAPNLMLHSSFNQTAAAAAPAGDNAYPGLTTAAGQPVTAAAAALGPLESLLTASSSSSGNSNGSITAAAASVLPDILPGLRGLLGAQEAAAVFSAAADQAAVYQARGGRRPWSYKSMAGTLPVSIKVREQCGCRIMAFSAFVEC
jgi:hypothetical protein